MREARGNGKGATPVARPTKLTPERLKRIRQAVRLGLSQEDAARAVGITARTWERWEAKARIVESWGERGKKSRAELVEMAKELGLNPDKITGSGKGGRVLNADLLREIEERAERFCLFRRELKNAEPWAEAAVLARLSALSEGGAVIVDPETGACRKLKRTRKVTKYAIRTQDDGTVTRVPVEEQETEEEWDIPPNALAQIKMLEIRWPEKYGRRSPLDPHDVEDPQRKAEELVESVRAMFGTVPGPESEP
jgi:DNA-binding XRE family transcriptional regulator